MRELEGCANELVILTFLNSSHTNLIFHEGRYVLSTPCLALQCCSTLDRKTSNTYPHHCPNPSVDSSRYCIYFLICQGGFLFIGSVLTHLRHYFLIGHQYQIPGVFLLVRLLCITDDTCHGINNSSRQSTAFRPMARRSLCSCSSDGVPQGLISDKMCLLQDKKSKKLRLVLREAKHRHKTTHTFWLFASLI